MLTRDKARQQSMEDVDSIFACMHPTAISSQSQIRELLERVRKDGITLRRGVNRRILPETALIDRIESDSLALWTTNFDTQLGHRIHLNFSIDGLPYFFSSLLIEYSDSEAMWIESPSVIYQSERREHLRNSPREGESTRVVLFSGNAECGEAAVVDSSRQGLGIVVTSTLEQRLGSSIRVRFLDGNRTGQELFAECRRRVPSELGSGWTRIGLGVSSTRRGAPPIIERIDSPDSGTLLNRAYRNWKIAVSAAQVLSGRTLNRLSSSSARESHLRIVDYTNDCSERIRAIINSTGSTKGAPCVVLPPAWGKTKESLMPLAMCLVGTFRAAGLPLTVVRFDGIRKRGESESGSGSRGRQLHEFTFSQGVRDIEATLDFLDECSEFRPSKTIIVSFSASSIEARRSVAQDHRIGGWVSVVGASDVQSMMRVISGGIDYAAGLERGLKFGIQTILGIEVDMDRAGADATENRLASLEDARRDMAQIRVPITWIHGRFDAWMDAGRAIDVLSRGESRNRKFIEVPTGHILRSSRQAFATFSVIAKEVSRMMFGSELPDHSPDVGEIEAQGRAERSRLPIVSVDLKAFWRDYLVGRDQDLGIELMTSISAYQDFMRAQYAQLRVADGDNIADFGAGTGAFPKFLATSTQRWRKLRVVEVDFVGDALRRARERIRDIPDRRGVDFQFVEADLNAIGSISGIPLESLSVDRALASLLISYISEPKSFLDEVFRVVRPGGRVVVSSLCPDADASKLYLEGVREFRSGLARAVFGHDGDSMVEAAARSYLNQATLLLDLEENGNFRFWEEGALKRLLAGSGFCDLSTVRSFGNPPQAIIVSGKRP